MPQLPGVHDMDGLKTRKAETLRKADVAGLFREEDIRRMARAVTKESTSLTFPAASCPGAGARKTLFHQGRTSCRHHGCQRPPPQHLRVQGQGRVGKLRGVDKLGPKLCLERSAHSRCFHDSSTFLGHPRLVPSIQSPPPVPLRVL